MIKAEPQQLQYVVNGRVVRAEGIIAQQRDFNSGHTKKRTSGGSLKRVDNPADAKFSVGWFVLGFSPEHLQQAEKQRGIDIAGAKALNAGEPHKPMPIPREWNQDEYMQTAKPKRVRAKPFEIESSADQCAELARKAGWLCVTVEQDLKA